MTEFAINVVAYGDNAGLGAWLDGHYRQHLKYNSILAGKTPAVVLPEFPILYWPVFGGGSYNEIKTWLDFHENWHEQLRPQANVTGSNLSDLEWTNPQYWYDWIDYHNAEHALLDKAFGA